MIARAIGGIAVDRGSGSGQPMRAAEAALKAGEVVIVLPQGTIPRGYDFFDPVLHGKTGTARLAAATGATVVPVGLWGTENVWPRSARLPDFTLVRNPPTVTVRVGKPVGLSLINAKADTVTIMDGHHRAAARRGAGAPRADARRARPHQAPSVRARLASATTRAVNAASRRLGRGQGTVAGGRAGLRVDPRLLEHLSAGRQVALVTGHQRKDDDDAAADGGARRDGRRRREQRDGLEHAAGPRRRAGRDPCRARRPRGGRGLPPPCAGGDLGGRGRPVEPVAGPARPHQRGSDGGGTLACGTGRGAAHACRRERRRSPGGVGRGRGA